MVYVTSLDFSVTGSETNKTGIALLLVGIVIVVVAVGAGVFLS